MEKQDESRPGLVDYARKDRRKAKVDKDFDVCWCSVGKRVVVSGKGKAVKNEKRKKMLFFSVFWVKITETG